MMQIKVRSNMSDKGIPKCIGELGKMWQNGNSLCMYAAFGNFITFGCESRVTGPNGEIKYDNQRKYIILGHHIFMYSGFDGIATEVISRVAPEIHEERTPYALAKFVQQTLFQVLDENKIKKEENVNQFIIASAKVFYGDFEETTCRIVNHLSITPTKYAAIGTGKRHVGDWLKDEKWTGLDNPYEATKNLVHALATGISKSGSCGGPVDYTLLFTDKDGNLQEFEDVKLHEPLCEKWGFGSLPPLKPSDWTPKKQLSTRRVLQPNGEYKEIGWREAKQKQFSTPVDS